MNILLTSAGRRTYMIDYFKEAMKGVGKVYASNSEYTYSLSHADDYILTPLIYGEGYIDFLLTYCKEKQITAIISLFDIDLYVLAKSKSLFYENGITIIVADPEAIAICNDKWLTYNFLKKNNIDCPRTYVDLEQVKKDVECGSLSYPLIIKPRWGMGSIGINVIDNEQELIYLYAKLKKKIFDSYLKYESKQDQENCIVVQEMITGQECGLDILNDLKRNFVTVVAKEKVSMRAGETDIAKTIDNEQFLGIAEILSKKLAHIGNLDVDVFKTDDDRILVLELNCRFGGQYPFSHLAGVNFPKQIVAWLQGKETENTYIQYKVNVLSCKDLNPVRLELV